MGLTDFVKEAKDAIERHPPPEPIDELEYNAAVHQLAHRLERTAARIDAEAALADRAMELVEARGLADLEAASDDDLRTLAMRAEIEAPPGIKPPWGENKAESVRSWLETRRAERAVAALVQPDDNFDDATTDRLVRVAKQELREQHHANEQRRIMRERTDWSDWFIEDYDAASKAWDEAHRE